jgi:hypothetical protein
MRKRLPNLTVRELAVWFLLTFVTVWLLLLAQPARPLAAFGALVAVGFTTAWSGTRRRPQRQ